MQRRRPFATWLAVVAMALHGLTPVAAQAQARESGFLVSVCTVGGATRQVELPAAPAAPRDSSSLHHGHCKLCLGGGAKPAVATAFPATQPVAPGSGAERIFLHAAPGAGNVAFANALPRAPPFGA
jgi:hypothetical protein